MRLDCSQPLAQCVMMPHPFDYTHMLLYAVRLHALKHEAHLRFVGRGGHGGVAGIDDDATRLRAQRSLASTAPLPSLSQRSTT